MCLIEMCCLKNWWTVDVISEFDAYSKFVISQIQIGLHFGLSNPVAKKNRYLLANCFNSSLEKLARL